MFFLQFKTLTADIDKEIIAHAAQRDPWSFYTFRICDLLAKFTGISSFALFFFYFLFLFFLKFNSVATSENAEIKEIGEFFANMFVALLTVSLTTSIIREALWGKLQPLIREGTKAVRHD